MLRAIQAVQPYGVDVSSGVERAPGKGLRKVHSSAAKVVSPT
jgi:phosphoribosylanthranilate isomerase